MFLSSLFLSAASAATFQVDPTGTCGTHTRISDAIADAGSGDTILITEGVHAENLGLVTDDLVFAPANLACTRDDSVIVRVDGGCLDRIATIGWGAHVRFEHLTLTNGCADDGGLLKVEVGSELTLDSVGLNHGWASDNGGAVYAEDADVTLEGSSFIELNEAGLDGGGLAVVRGTLRIGGNSLVGAIAGNIAGVNGGGIRLSGGTLMLTEDARVAANLAGMAGGGVYASPSGTTSVEVYLDDRSAIGGAVTSLGNRAPSAGGIQLNSGRYGTGYLYVGPEAGIEHNTATMGEGGGLYQSGGSWSLANTAYVHGSISHNHSGNTGGGARVTSSKLFLYGATVAHNTATRSGGGLFGYGGDVIASGLMMTDNTARAGGGMMLDASSNASISDGHLLRNEATADKGGAVHLRRSSNLVLTKFDSDGQDCEPLSLPVGEYCSALQHNTAALDGAGVYVSTLSTADISMTAIQHNVAGGDGAALALEPDTIAVMQNNLITDNHGESTLFVGEGQLQATMNTILDNPNVPLWFDLDTSRLAGNIIWNNADDPVLDFSGSMSAICNDIQGVSGSGLFAGTGNIRTNPMLGSDYHPTSVSPVNVCGGGPATDMDLDSRPQDGAFDMGAFEGPR